ncbi:transcription termination factor NusA [Limosilactobacillus mucosae]|uniref:transcription termination factor NusA n=1 Tax=Limosilactobacillus mucosae TaxID=97478 RepID=UPI0022E3AE9F|nr:transcription termination factor NusA [Limosilactobacillus mucosae]
MSTKKQKQAQELLDAMNVLEKEKGIKKEVVIEALTDALEKAYKTNYNASNVEVKIDENTGEFKVFSDKTVVAEVENPKEQISLHDAWEKSHGYSLGDTFQEEVTPHDFGRLAAQTAKNIVLQKLREAERDRVINKYDKMLNELVEGEVSREDNRFIYIDLGDGVEAGLSKRQTMPNEEYRIHDRVQVYIYKVADAKPMQQPDGTQKRQYRGPLVLVSRTDPGMLKRLFEKEVPELKEQNGPIEWKGSAREAGDRSKVAVASKDPNIDPVGTCVGPRGARVQAIVNQLGGENIDIIEYSSDPAIFIKNALKPATVDRLDFDDNNGEEEDTGSVDREGNKIVKVHHGCTVYVPDDQLSLAIGKRGQNVRLAAQLTKYKIDIKPSSEAPAVEDQTDDFADDAQNDAMDGE